MSRVSRISSVSMWSDAKSQICTSVQGMTQTDIWVFSNIGVFPPKWMVSYNEKPYEQMGDLGEKKNLFLETPI